MPVLARRPAVPDVSAIPTPPLQAAAVFIVWFFTLLALVAFLMRVWSRVRLTRQWGLDDWLMVPAVVCSMAMSVPFYMYIKLGYFGYYATDVPPDYDPSPGLYVFYIAQIFYNPILALVKCSVLVFILRLCGKAKEQRGVRWAAYGIIAFTALQAIGVFLGVVLQCIPISAVWGPSSQKDAKCIDNSFHVTISSLTVLTDILVLALPFHIFLGLQMRRTTKLAVLSCFALGTAVTAVSIARIVLIVQLFYFPSPTADPFHNISLTLSIIEPNLAIATACIPALRPLFTTHFPSVCGTDNTSESPTSNHPIASPPHTHMRKSSYFRSSISAIVLDDLMPAKLWHEAHARSRSSTESREKVLGDDRSEVNSILVTTDVRVESRTSKLPPHVRSASRGTSRGSVWTVEGEFEKGGRDVMEDDGVEFVGYPRWKCISE